MSAELDGAESFPPSIPAEVQGWIRAFRAEPPLHTQFPVVLPNGGRIANLTAVCSGCRQPIDPAMVHGRMMWSLPTVATVEGNGYCARCQRITHLHCRFRAHQETYQAEWPGLDGRWYAKVATPTPAWRRIVALLCQLLARLRRT